MVKSEENRAMYEAFDETEEDFENTQENKFLTFRLGKEEYGIEIKDVTEIIGIQNITEVPDMPKYVKGVINLRGKVIPVMDVRMRFKMQPFEYNDRTCIIVIDVEKKPVGLIVDYVSEVVDIPSQNVEPPPQVSKNSNNIFLKGIGKVGDSIKILLETEKILYAEFLEKVKEEIKL